MIKPGQSSALRFLAGGVIAGLLVFLAIALSTWLYKPLTDKATVPPPSERLSEPAIAQLIADCRREQTIGYDPNPLDFQYSLDSPTGFLRPSDRATEVLERARIERTRRQGGIIVGDFDRISISALDASTLAGLIDSLAERRAQSLDGHESFVYLPVNEDRSYALFLDALESQQINDKTIGVATGRVRTDLGDTGYWRLVIDPDDNEVLGEIDTSGYWIRIFPGKSPGTVLFAEMEQCKRKVLRQTKTM